MHIPQKTTFQTHSRPAFSVAPQSAIASMQDLHDWCIGTERPEYAAAIARLAVLLPGRPLWAIPATEEALAHILPKATSRVPNPFPGHIKTSGAYKDFRRRVQAALRKSTGYADDKAAREARRDGWHDIFTTLTSEVAPGGAVAAVSLTPIKRVIDACRRLDFEPWHMGDADAIQRLEESALHNNERKSWARGLAALQRYGAVLPAVQEALPAGPIPSFTEVRRLRAKVPDHLDEQITKWIESASHEGIDEITGKPVNPRSTATRNRYRAALRHYLTILAETGHPVDGTNDLGVLFHGRVMAAYLAAVDAKVGQKGCISEVSATHYVTDLLTVASRNGVDVSEASRTVGRDEMIQSGRDKRQQMSKSTRDFCERLLADPAREKTFSTQYLLYHEKAEAMLQTVGGDAGRLSARQKARLIQFGVMAGFGALSLRGSPDRKGSILQMQLHGHEPHVIAPDRHHKEWRFWLPTELTKARKERPLMPITGKGSDVFGWYVERIRPLLDRGRNLPWLFPARKADDHLSATVFDTYILEASDAIGLPMTAHKFRSGQATRLLASSWANLPIAAELLGNTPDVCARHYAWINKEKLRRDTYAVLDAREDEVCR